jgi:hypothetical protein
MSACRVAFGDLPTRQVIAQEHLALRSSWRPSLSCHARAKFDLARSALHMPVAPARPPDPAARSALGPLAMRPRPVQLVDLVLRRPKIPPARHPCRNVKVGYEQRTTQASRRRTGGERPATRQQQPTHNDTRRQGERRNRSIAAGRVRGDACVHTAEATALRAALTVSRRRG